MIDTFEPPRNVELDWFDNENHNWNLVKTFDMSFDDEHINFIDQTTNAWQSKQTQLVGYPLIAMILAAFLGFSY